MDEKYTAMANCISHETSLINTRVGWALTFQGLLISAFVFSLKLESARFLSLMIPLLGMGSAVLTNIGVYAANRAIDNAKDEWESNGDDKLITLYSDKKSSRLGRLHTYLFIILIALFWLVILFNSLVGLNVTN